MKKYLVYGLPFCLFLLAATSSVFAADEEEFVPAYQNVENIEVPDPNKYVVKEGGRVYYTSGKKNGFRVNENNEESTDLTIGILSFPLAPVALAYMNFMDWWE